MKPVLITAHSGCDGKPDNSKEFIDYAIKLPVDCFEVDVRRRSGNLVLAHDDDDECILLSYAFEQLAKDPSKKINCDLKQPDLESEVFNLARNYGVQNQVIYSGSVSFETMSDAPQLKAVEWYVNLEIVFPSLYEQSPLAHTDFSTYAQAAEYIKECLKKFNGTCINMDYMLYSKDLGSALKEADIPLSLWTPSQEDELSFFLSDGVHNITTRNTAAACRLRG